MSSGRGVGKLPIPAGPTGAGSAASRSAPASPFSSSRDVMRVISPALEPGRRRGLQHRRPEVRLLTGGGWWPGLQPGHQHLDNCRGIVVGPAPSGPTWVRRATGAAGCRPAIVRHRGFDSLPAHRCASRLTGRRVPVPSVARQHLSTWPNGSRRRSTKPEGAGSTPAVDAHLAVAQKDESTALRRRGSHVRICRRGRALVDRRSPRRGPEPATLAMTVRARPTTRFTHHMFRPHQPPPKRGVTCPPPSIPS